VDNFKQQVRVNSSGGVTLPYVGTVPVMGMTATEVEEKVKTLLDGKYIKNPQVSVFVAEYRSQPVFVLGAVMRPGQYQITSSLQLVDAIALAGGLNTETAAGYAVIQRRGREQPAPAAQSTGPMDGQAARVAATSASPSVVSAQGKPHETTRVDLRDLLDNGNLELNVPIQGGDVVQIPEKQLERFYVIGDVNRPGAYELPTEDKLLVTQALAWAGGPLRTAKKSKGVLVRYDEKGGRQEMAINVDDIMKGKKTDITVLPNDVIFLPGSTAKSIGYGLLGVLPGTASSALVYGTVRR
jgi:polysaccharide export outer membrane protein